MTKQTFIEGENFWISFNPNADGAETALCQEARPCYLILKGDYLEKFKDAVPLNYEECLKIFKELVKNGAEMSQWSEELPKE